MRGETFNVAALCEISRAHNRLDAGLLERVRERLHRFLTQIGQHQFGTFAREIMRDRLRDAAGCTRDQRAFAIEPIALAISFSDSRHLQFLFAHLYSILHITIRFYKAKQKDDQTGLSSSKKFKTFR